MPDRFLTISEAETFTGKSRSTLRRFIDGIVKAENSPDRVHLKPSVDEVASLREQNQPFSWRISEELLRRQFVKPEESAPTPEEGSATASSDSSRLVTVLEKSITMLERELAEKNSQIAAMNERLRESNILMKDLQQRLALPAPASSDPVEARPMPVSELPATTPEPVRKRPFHWLFGK